MIDSSIFRSNDIRGKIGEQLTIEAAYNIGFYFGKLVQIPKNNKIIVGFDGRTSSPALFDALTSGLLDSGCDVTSIGLVPTPCLYFADKKLEPAGSIMITASHNEKNYNGFKMISRGKSFYGDDIKNLYKIISSSFLDIYGQNSSARKITKINIKPIYIEKILRDMEINSALKIIWDSGNGAAGSVLRDIIEKLPNENHIINEEINGDFPNHDKDHNIEVSLSELSAKVKEKEAHLGIAFDGDADRIAVVTSNGEIVYGDQLLCIYAKELLERKPESLIIADIKSSDVFPNYVKNLGGRSLIWKTGHSFMKAKMQELKAEIAGEMSGHIFFSDGYLAYDDGLYAALRLLHVISKLEKNIEELLEEQPKFANTPEIRLRLSDKKKFAIIEEIKNLVKEENIDFNDLDGVRAKLPNGWWLVRASNTEDAIIVRAEANNKIELREIIEKLNNILSKFDLKVDY